MSERKWHETGSPSIDHGEEQIFEVWYESQELLTHLTYQGGLGWCGEDPDYWRSTTPPEQRNEV